MNCGAVTSADTFDCATTTTTTAAGGRGSAAAAAATTSSYRRGDAELATCQFASRVRSTERKRAVRCLSVWSELIEVLVLPPRPRRLYSSSVRRLSTRPTTTRSAVRWSCAPTTDSTSTSRSTTSPRRRTESRRRRTASPRRRTRRRRVTTTPSTTTADTIRCVDVPSQLLAAFPHFSLISS